MICHPHTLIDFALWAIANDPLANTYILDLWDHGGGVTDGCCVDATSYFKPPNFPLLFHLSSPSPIHA